MDSLIQDTLDYVREVAKTTPSLFATREEADCFAPRISKPKKEAIKALSPPLPKKTAPAPQKVEPHQLPKW